jgi:glutamate/tyrosine decarboxylase-like PLP-dependent enzyme
MRPILYDAAARAARYLEDLATRRVGPSPDAVNRLPELGGPFPEGPSDAEAVLAALDATGSPATVASAGGRYFGFVVGGSLPAALAANWLAGAWDQNAGMWVSSPASAALEEIALRWLVEALRLPGQCGGALVTGTTMANFSGLAAARHAILARAGWDVEADGLFGAPPITVIVGDEVHVSLLKALGMLGLGRERVVRIPTDGQGRMRSDALPRLTDRTIVCAQAGNVNTGAFDPIGGICAAAHDAGAWVHVDGAFGLWAAACPALADLVRGTENADSWAVDAHKWLNTPYDGGAVFVRDAGHLTAAMSASAAAYLPQGGRRDPMRYTPELSRRARGVEIWAALRSLGRSGLAELIERTCRYARRFADGLAAAGYPPLNDVVLNQLLVSFGDDEATRRVIDGVQADGTCWCGGTVWHGRAAMRISVSSWATTEQDIDRSLTAVLEIAANAGGRAASHAP